MLEFRSDKTFGVARETLLVEARVLCVAHPVFRNLGQSLFNAGIASLAIIKEMTEALVLFCGQDNLNTAVFSASFFGRVGCDGVVLTIADR